MHTFMLEDAIAHAATAHREQWDLGGLPYILHPLRVMMKVETNEERMAAVLHDVLEDTGTIAEDLLRLGCPIEVVEAVDVLTRRPDESYEAFIERVAQNAIARRVKLADLEDNLNTLRLRELTDRDLQHVRRYHQAWHQLQQVPW